MRTLILFNPALALIQALSKKLLVGPVNPRPRPVALPSSRKLWCGFLQMLVEEVQCTRTYLAPIRDCSPTSRARARACVNRLPIRGPLHV